MSIINIWRNRSWVRFRRFVKRCFQNKSEKENRKQLKNLQERLKELLRKDQYEYCLHLQGSNVFSRSLGTRTSIVWHFFNDKVWRGFCTNCQRQFIPTDTDYKKWFEKRSGNLASTSTSVPDGFSIPNCYVGGSMGSGSLHELDNLSDEEINSLFEEVCKHHLNRERV